jgi:hypothetical protein
MQTLTCSPVKVCISMPFLALGKCSVIRSRDGFTLGAHSPSMWVHTWLRQSCILAILGLRSIATRLPALAVNAQEGDYYPPGSFHIDYGTHSMGAHDHEHSDAGTGGGQPLTLPQRRGGRKHDWFRAERGRLAGEPDWLQADHDAHALAKHDHEALGAHHHGDGAMWNGQFPTGEFCGAMFWLKLNQRFHRLWPDNETFVGEIEREVYNEALTHQAPNGAGIRCARPLLCIPPVPAPLLTRCCSPPRCSYFSNLNGVKEDPGTIGTCCEGQGTRLYGSLNEYLFSLSPAGEGSRKQG